MGVHQTYIPNPLVEENTFREAECDGSELPHLDEVRQLLPKPYWEGHRDAIDCYWKAWELAFQHLRRPTAKSGFVAPFIDTAFNDCLFMWDSAFILLFARYGSRAFNFQQTLDNFYARQHDDGFICREIREADGQDMFERHDPASTGPNVLPWAEWEYFLNFGDRERLAKGFPCLLAYYEWFQHYRSWPDGSYWSCGWGCGMDNQPRLPKEGRNEIHAANFSHGHMAWIDTTLQQLFSGKLLMQMARVLERSDEVARIEAEVKYLAARVNEFMWNDEIQFYVDRFRDGTLSPVQSIGSYWALLAEVVPRSRVSNFVAHLSDEKKFNRPHRIPSLAADTLEYNPDGEYWLGGVWAPATYMVLRGLSQTGFDALAHEVAQNHHRNVVEVFRQTGTLWENYAPEKIAPGQPAHPDFVGWSGLPPIAVLFEFIFGLRPDVPAGKLIWDVRLLEEHGVTQYPFGEDGLLNLRCARRDSIEEEPQIEAESVGAASTTAVKLEVLWQDKSKTIHIRG